MDDLPSSSAKMDAMMKRWEAMEASLELIAHELWYNEVQQQIHACVSASTLVCYVVSMSRWHTVGTSCMRHAQVKGLWLPHAGAGGGIFATARRNGAVDARL
jgi:hypothetical protein